VARAFQQFSRFRLGKADLTQHHLLKHNQIRKSGNVLKSLPGELREPGELLADSEEAIPVVTRRP
jgi:hypothetical protein